jgi:hypothetical protein
VSEAIVLVERRERVAVLSLNRPEARNAINTAITVAMADAIEEAEADDGVWVIVITGSGDQSFCAGADLKEFAAGRQSAEVRWLIALIARGTLALWGPSWISSRWKDVSPSSPVRRAGSVSGSHACWPSRGLWWWLQHDDSSG